MSMYAQKGNLRREAGWGFMFDPDKGCVEECGYEFCVHCGGQFKRQPGSGRIRGYCQNCGGFVCGPGCAECVPVELLLENIEAGRPLNYKPIKASITAEPPKSAGGVFLG